ncbi:MAG: ADP-forming succinate--CoA ligase subunit beta [Candidatus Delongbacteria bacterium]|nr:ADP-forming succinate--CoA ligase subunit beta [Candidatus Delongbacteria bacterium]MCG2760823.1 ADP-forming succinate--CoA ligase subunit beta [Candidatus Delongbacteria bacterium]
MKIHEYQAKELFAMYDIPIPKGKMIHNPEDAMEAAREIGGGVWAVKAQIHAGGRGKGGGVKLARSLTEVSDHAKSILGMNLVTAQTGHEGQFVRKVYIEGGVDIAKEFYLGMVLDRASELPVMMVSTEGGMEIEKVAEETPGKIIKVYIDPLYGLQAFQIMEMGFKIGLHKNQLKEFYFFAKKLYELYIDLDASIVEINPLVLTNDDKFLALDAKIAFDDNALYRHDDIVGMRDFSEEEPAEMEAGKYGLNYVKLDGNVGCMVNGAGLAMSTMDIIKHEGGNPANFLDVGGGASASTVAKGFEIILKDQNVKAIFVNIFGGIVRCDRIANGILEAIKLTKVTVPIIVRLDGTNSEEASEILRNANIENIIPAKDLADGAKLAVKAAEGK